MEIREIELVEIEGVLKLIDQFERPMAPWPTQGNIKQIFSNLKESGGCVIGAIKDEEIVGTCTVNLCPNFSWSGRSYAVIENVIVSKAHRKQGIGKALLAEAKNYAQRKNCYKVMLFTGSNRDEVLDFYKSAGFEGTKTGFQSRFDA